MAVSILFGMLPTTVSAVAPGLQIKENSIDADAATTIPTSLSNGEIWTDKSVVPDATNPGEFTITLSAAGQDFQIENPLPQDKLDVVLLLDVSTSMNEKPTGQSKTKLESMKEAASDAVTTLLGVNGNRVAIVSYSDYATRRTGNNDSSAFLTNENNLKQAISGLNASGYTNIQNAFLRAQEIIEARTNKVNRPVIILMSDGEPTVYHSSLTQHNDSNRSRSTSSGADYVWNTILQAMKAKEEIPDLRIFTIGFGVGGSAYAVATLMPTEGNTENYRPTVYSAKTRIATETANFEYNRQGSSNNYTLRNPIQVQEGSSSIEYGPESLVTGLTSEPQDTLWSTPTREGSVIQTGNSQNRRYYFKGTRTRTEYFDKQSEKAGFDHKYWENGSKITSDGAEDIMEALTGIVNDLVSAKPMSKTGQGSYTDIIIEDILGDGFEVVGTLDTSLSQSGNKITWTIDGDEFDTMASGSTSLVFEKIKTVSFRVKISNSANVAGKYYTNDSAQAAFNVSEDNPFYEGSDKKGQNGDITESLDNKGWLILENTPNTLVTITITKEVSGPLPADEENTFTFNVYLSPQGGNPLNETPISITVTGDGSENEAIGISLPWNAFNEAGQVKLYVEEIESAPNGYWTYENSERKDVTLTKTEPNGSVIFTNIYTPPGNIHVTKVWRIGESNQWPDDVNSILVLLWEEAPIEELSGEILFLSNPEDLDDLGNDEDLGEPDTIDNGENDDEGEPYADDDGENDDEVEPDANDNGGNDEEVEPDADDNGSNNDEGEPEADDNGENDDEVEPDANDNGSNNDEGEPDANDNGGNDEEVEPDANDNSGNDGITLTSNAQLFFSEPDTTPTRTLIGQIELTSDNQANYFDDFVKKEGYRYYLSEVTVNGYSTEMSGDIEDGEVIFDEDNRAVITITNTGNAPGINVTKKVLNSPLTLSSGKATFNYRLVITNTGNTTLMNVSVDDVMSFPAGASIEYLVDTNADFNLDFMEPGEIRTIEYSVTVDKAGTYENTATATGLGYNDEEEYSSEDSATAIANNPTIPPTNPPGGGGSTPRQGTVRVRFVDVDGNVLSAEYQFIGRVGTSFETTARDIEGYTLTEIPGNAEGVFINGTITVVYVYNADSEDETEIDIEEEETPEGLPEEPIGDEEFPKAGELLPQTGLPIVTVSELLGGSLIALGLYFGRKAKKDKE